MKTTLLLNLLASLLLLHVYGKKPNILFIMSDDHAAHAISAYGGRLAKIAPTPNLDRLAKEGALFKNAFCTNSICSPSRACVLTGQYNHTNGAVDLSGKVMPGKHMLAIEMKNAGYETAMIGSGTSSRAQRLIIAASFRTGKYHGPSFRIRGDKPWGKNLIEFPENTPDAITDLHLSG